MRGSFRPTDARSLAMAAASRRATLERVKLIEMRNSGLAGAGAEALMNGALLCMSRLQQETAAWIAERATPQPQEACSGHDTIVWRRAG